MSNFRKTLIMTCGAMAMLSAPNALADETATASEVEMLRQQVMLLQKRLDALSPVEEITLNGTGPTCEESPGLECGTGSVAGVDDTAIGVDARAVTNGSTAVGKNADASISATSVGMNATSSSGGVAFGHSSTSGSSGVAIGINSSSSNSGTAVGSAAKTTDIFTVAVGSIAEANGQWSTAIGYSSDAVARTATALGAQSRAAGESSLALGYNSTSNLLGSIAIGAEATVSGNSSIGIGTGTDVFEDGAIAIGGDGDDIGSFGARALNTQATAIGADAIADGIRATAIGSASLASGDGSAAIGNNATSIGSKSVAIGDGSSSNGDDTVAIGNGADVTGTNAMAVGRRATANGIRATALGSQASADGLNATALGASSSASGGSAFALGTAASASGTRSVAIGREATTASDHTNSVAIGFGATTTMMNQMMFGTATMTYVMPGIVSTASKNQQVGAVYYVTSDASGNLAVTDDPVPPSDNSNTPSGDASVSTQSDPGKTTAANIDAAETITDPVDTDLIGSNLNYGGTPAARSIPGTRQSGRTLSSENLSTSAVNAQAIEINRQEISKNSIKIDQAFARIATNSDAIAANTLQITDLQEGLAAVAALPDMYLNPDEKWAAGGSVAVFGEEIGVGATLTVRGNDNWSFGASAGMGGDEATGKIQIRYAGTNF